MNNSTRLSSVCIKGLFGMLDYDIRMNPGTKPLIITAPNGYGKTTILNIINAISKGNVFYFLTFPFQSIQLTYLLPDEDVIDERLGYVSILIKSTYTFAKEKNTSSEHQVGLEAELHADDAAKTSKETSNGCITFTINTPFSEESFEINDNNLKKAIRRLGYYRRLETHEFDVRSASYYNFIQQHSEDITRILINDSNSAFFLYLNILDKSFLIPAQRLFYMHDDKWKNRTEAISEDMKKILQHYQRKYLITSQIKDAGFIQNVLKATQSITADAYNKLKSELEDKIRLLRKYDLLNDISIPDFSESHAAMMGCYIRDLNEKLKVFDDILNKVVLFGSLLDSKRFTNKTIEVSLDAGIRARSSFDNSFISLESLSSGEKNEIILLYELIFSVEDNSILLIDEPEISLHVSWQLTFMKELEKISHLKHLTTIVATHSPQIINADWKSSFDLYAESRRK